MSKGIEELIGEESFIYGPRYDTVEEALFGGISCHDSAVDLMEELAELNTESCEQDTAALHGVLARAAAIPAEIPYGMDAYLIVLQGTSGTIIEIQEDDKAEGLVDAIGAFASGELEDGDGEQLEAIDIDDMYVLYGYQLEVVLTIDEDKVDEEKIVQANRIFEEIEEMVAENEG